MEVQWKGMINTINMDLWKSFTIVFCRDFEYGCMFTGPKHYPILLYKVCFCFLPKLYLVHWVYILQKTINYFFYIDFTSHYIDFFFFIVLCCSAGVQCEPPKSIYARISPVLPIYYYGNVVTAECDIGYTIIIVRTHKEASATWWIAFYVNNYTFDNFFRKK